MYPGRPFRTVFFPARAILFLIGILSCFAPPAMAADDGNIVITSSPPARDACLDSASNSGNCQLFNPTGTTQLYNIPGESDHTVSVWLDGYEPYIATIHVPSGKTVEVNAVLQPGTLPTTAPPAPASGFLDNIIGTILNKIFGRDHANPSGPSQPVTTSTPSVTVPVNPSPDKKITAAYFYLFDDGYEAAMSVQDQIPWKKVNRIYIGFATIHDGQLVDLPVGDSTIDQGKREDNARKIRNVIALCRQNNPDAEIFIVSNFGGSDMDNEYLNAARDPQRFADSVVAYLKEYGIDGYDMDWESRNIDDYASQMNTLLSTCHATFVAAGNNQHGRPWLLTHTVWPGVESAQTVATIKDSVDQLNLMTYGPGDGYDLVSYANKYHDVGVPYSKMIGGVESEFGYPENGGPDTQASANTKCTFVKTNNLAGLFEWRMDNDMRTPDGVNAGGPPTFQVTNWMSDCLSG